MCDKYNVLSEYLQLALLRLLQFAFEKSSPLFSRRKTEKEECVPNDFTEQKLSAALILNSWTIPSPASKNVETNVHTKS